VARLIVLILRNLQSIKEASRAAQTCRDWNQVFDSVLTVLLLSHCGKPKICLLDEDDWRTLDRAVRRTLERRPSDGLKTLPRAGSAVQRMVQRPHD